MPRAKGVPYVLEGPVVRRLPVPVSDTDEARIAFLRKRWNVSDAEVVRKALRLCDAAEHNAVLAEQDAPKIRKAMRELAAAAESDGA